MPGNRRGRPRLAERVEPIYPNRRKVCPMCKVEKPWRAFYPKSRHADNTVASVRSRCRLCESGIAKARWQSWVEGGKLDDLNERRRAEHARKMATDPAYAEKFRRDAREAARFRYATDPEFRAREIAKSAAFAKSARGRKLERRRRARARAERRRETSRDLPAAPWREWLNDMASRFESRQELADWLGIDEATVRKWREGKEGIRLDRADRTLCHVGEPHMLMFLWPELYDESEAA